MPNSVSWVYILMSTVTQTFYMSLVAAAYKSGDMSEAYPIMRGTPPLLVALVSAPLVGEVMGWKSWLGIVFICSGVLAMALEARRRNRGTSSRTAMLALTNAGFIAGYTIIDGLGVRASGAPLSYTLWLFVINAVPLAGWALYREPDRFISYMRNRWRPALIGGVGTLGSYGLALWAMTMAPIAVVAALRETAILFGMIISAVVLKEKVGLPRFAAAALIVLGAITLRLS
jgi:drug/metabolite transporter (DMT)-like permease